MRHLLLLSLFVLAVQAQPSDQTDLSVIPTPLSVQRLTGTFRISSSVRIILGEQTTAVDVQAADAVNEALAERDLPVLKTAREKDLRSIKADIIYIGHPESRRGKAALERTGTTFAPEMTDEGYVLLSGVDGVTVLGASPRGRYYGVMTLVQLLRSERRGVVVPALIVADRPLQKIRGITDDISRGQVSTMDDFKKIIRSLARYKMNVYAPYLEDMFVFRNHPAIGRGRGALTAEELRELDVYARRYHVELIPIFETLGHWENILLQPEYRDLGEFPGAHTLNVSDERVYAILDEMIGEIAASTSSPWFHMAADESWDVGLGVNKARVAASDLATVHAEHYLRVVEILKKHGKQPMMYGDIILDHPAILSKLPKEVVVVDWQYWAGDKYPSPSIFANAGVPFVVSPAVYNFTGPFPNYVHTFINIRNFALDGYRNGSQGLLTSNWNDFGGEALRSLNALGYGWTAEVAWNPERANADNFRRAFFADHFGSEVAGTAAHRAYLLLSDPLNLIYWHELWRHPMLPLRQAPLNYMWRVEGIRSTSPAIADLLREVRANAKKNVEHVRALEFILRLNDWFSLKLERGEAIRRLTKSPPPGSDQDSVRKAALALTDGVVASLRKVQQEFRDLWLTTNRPEGLDLLMKRYDRQAAYWDEKREQLEKGEVWREPEITSAWIYHPAGNPGKRDSAAQQVRNAVFRKEFNVPDSIAISNAWLQLIGDTQARLEVNGNPIGEVFARRSLSLIVEQERVKAWDLSSSLRPGSNEIVIRTDNYATFGSAGVNVWFQIGGTSGSSMTVHSDSTWQVSEAGAGTPVWVPVRTVAYPWPVVAPDPANGRWSWIER